MFHTTDTFLQYNNIYLKMSSLVWTMYKYNNLVFVCVYKVEGEKYII